MQNLHVICGTCATAALAIGLAVGQPSVARAQSQGDFAEMAAAMKRLEARVTSLEDENKQAKRETEAVRAEARALRQKLGVASTPPVTLPASASAKAAGTYALATKAPLAAAPPSWKGFYAGAAFGMGWMRTKEDLTQSDVFADVFNEPGIFTKPSPRSRQTAAASVARAMGPSPTFTSAITSWRHRASFWAGRLRAASRIYARSSGERWPGPRT